MLLRFALAILAVTGTMADAGTLRKVWDFDAGAPGVYALSFSPDGRHIVVVAGPSWDKQFVLVLDDSDPQANPRHLELNHKSFGGIAWSPSGQQLIIDNTRVRLADGATCSLQDGAGLHFPFFVSEDRLVSEATRPVGPFVPGVSRWGHKFLSFFNSDCQSTGSRDLPIEQYLFDVSAEQGIICVRQGNRASIMPPIIDSSTGTELLQLPALGWQLRVLMNPVRFADGGKSICGVVGASLEEAVSCLDVDTANEIATTRIRGSLKKRIVWDFGTGKELASWRPKSQRVIDPYPTSEESHPYAFDISPDGEYIVEGGAGTISLYRIEP